MNFSIDNELYKDVCLIDVKSAESIAFDEEVANKKDYTKIVAISLALLFHVLLILTIASLRSDIGYVFGKGISKTNIISVSLVRGLNERTGGGLGRENNHEAKFEGVSDVEAKIALISNNEGKISRSNKKETKSVSDSEQDKPSITQTLKKDEVVKKIEKRKSPPRTEKHKAVLKESAPTEVTKAEKPKKSQQNKPKPSEIKQPVQKSLNGDEHAKTATPNQNKGQGSVGSGVSERTMLAGTEKLHDKGYGDFIGGINGFGNYGKGESPQPSPIKIGFGSSNGPRIIRQVAPRYPSVAKRKGIEGLVELEIHLDEQGNLIDAKLINSVHPELDEEALRVARKSKYAPAKNAGKNIACISILPFNFKLKS